jgi:hypothetical protein
MSIFDGIGRFGASLRKARRNSQAIRDMNALPPDLQKEIGWPATPGSQSGLYFQSAYWKTLR